MKTFRILVAALCMSMAASCTQTAQNEQQTADRNAVIETIKARRSIRNYRQVPVGRDTLNIIMECGINAPNGQNKQSWEVRVVDNQELLAQMSQAMGDAHPGMEFARDPSYDFSAYDCGLLAENVMLSAWSLGVGSVCLGSPVRFLTDNELCKPYIEKLGFTEGYELCLCVGLGYAAEQPAAKPRDNSKVKFID